MWFLGLGREVGGGHNVMTSVCVSLTLTLVRLGDLHLCLWSRKFCILMFYQVIIIFSAL